MPRNAHRVKGMALLTASEIGRLLGFQAAASTSGLNQNQPMMHRPATGMITPQTVTAPILPVMLGPPKLARVVNQSRPTVPMNNGMAPPSSSPPFGWGMERLRERDQGRRSKHRQERCVQSR